MKFCIIAAEVPPGEYKVAFATPTLARTFSSRCKSKFHVTGGSEIKSAVL